MTNNDVIVQVDESKSEKGVPTMEIGEKTDKESSFWTSPAVVTLAQKLATAPPGSPLETTMVLRFVNPDKAYIIRLLFAELIGTYFVIFSGCGSVAVNKIYGSVTFPGICVVWGLIVMVMIYSVGHISGAHFNPAVTITFAIFRRFPWNEVPMYIASQLIGSILASGTLALMFNVTREAFFGTTPVGSNGQSLAIEIVISFLLMFVISGVATDNRAIGELGGLAIGMTIMLNVFVAGPISGASMNPARSIGPALVKHVYKGLWVYILGPLIGTIAGAFCYNLIRFTDKTLREITKSSYFMSRK